MIHKLCAALALWLCLGPATGAHAQVKVDETSLMTRLLGLNRLSATDAVGYFVYHGYTAYKTAEPAGTYTREVFTCTKDKDDRHTHAYLLFTIRDGGVTGSGYTTPNNAEYRQALKTARQMGFVRGATLAKNNVTRVSYTKGKMHLTAQAASFANRTTYLLVLNYVTKQPVPDLAEH